MGMVLELGIWGMNFPATFDCTMEYNQDRSCVSSHEKDENYFDNTSFNKVTNFKF